MNVYYDIISPYVTTPRHVVRLENTIAVTWSAVRQEVNVADFLALEVIRLYDTPLFAAIQNNMKLLCGTGGQEEHRRNLTDRMNQILPNLTPEKADFYARVLSRLFPRFERIGYSSSARNQWDAERRVCIEAHFDTYFRLTLSDGALPIASIDALVTRASDKAFIQSTFRSASQTTTRHGNSLVPIYLDELMVHSHRVKREDIEPLLTALFEIHDEIDLKSDADKGFMGIANTTIRYHWLVRRIAEPLTLEERSQLLMSALRNASLTWLIDFTSSSRKHYSEREDRTDEAFVKKDDLGVLTQSALGAIRSSSEDGSLISKSELVYLLYRWRDLLDGDATEVRAWTNSQLTNTEGLIRLAEGFTSQSWSMGIGGDGVLADRVSTPRNIVRLAEDADIIDSSRFRTEVLKLLSSDKLSVEQRAIASTFIEAWTYSKSDEF